MSASPECSCEARERLLAQRIVSGDVPNILAIPESVSPTRTTYVLVAGLAPRGDMLESLVTTGAVVGFEERNTRPIKAVRDMTTTRVRYLFIVQY